MSFVVVAIMFPLADNPVILNTAGSKAKRILVVDDYRDSADSQALLLRSVGHVVEVAYSSESALDLAQTFLPHSVLLDIALPRIDGFHLTRRLREDERLCNTLFIAISGFHDAAYIARAKAVGIAHYLIKPADIDELTDLLDQQAATISSNGIP